MKNLFFSRRLIIVATLAALLLSCSTDQPQTDIPILAWHGPDFIHSTEPVFRDMQRCGFTINFSSYGKREKNIKALELALKTGVKLLISDSRISVSKILQDSTALAALDSVVIDYIAHPALFGYYIVDEPNAKDFAALAKIVEHLREKDPIHIPYINLFPNYATPVQLGVQTYSEYVEKFMETVHPPILSFDHYPITDEGLREYYFENLKIIRAAALKYKVPFWGFALSVAHGPYPKPHQGHIRFQLYCNLAYGAKGLQYFTYATPRSSRWDFHEAILDTSGNKTTIYRDAQFINNEIHKLAPVLNNLRSIGVYHTTPLPPGCDVLPPGLAVEFVEEGEVVIGLFRDSKEHTYVMVVNRDYLSGAMPRVYFAKNVKGIIEVSKNTEQPMKVKFGSTEIDKAVSILLKAGEGRLYQLHM